MKEQIEIALWDKVKSTYPSGTSKHTNALLEEDFDSFIEDVVKICTMPDVVMRRAQLRCEHKGRRTATEFVEYCEDCKKILYHP